MYLSKLMLVSDQEGVLALLDSCQKVIFCFELRSQFLSRINRGIQRTTQCAFQRREMVEQFVQTDLANDHQVDIARRVFVSARERTIDKSEFNPFRQWGEGRRKQVKDASGFCKKRVELGERWVVAVCLIEHLVSVMCSKNQTDAREGGQLTLDSTNTDVDTAGNLTNEEGVVRHAIQSRKDTTPSLAKQKVPERCISRSHYENNCTHIENRKTIAHLIRLSPQPTPCEAARVAVSWRVDSAVKGCPAAPLLNMSRPRRWRARRP